MGVNLSSEDATFTIENGEEMKLNAEYVSTWSPIFNEQFTHKQDINVNMDNFSNDEFICLLAIMNKEADGDWNFDIKVWEKMEVFANEYDIELLKVVTKNNIEKIDPRSIVDRDIENKGESEEVILDNEVGSNKEEADINNIMIKEKDIIINNIGVDSKEENSENIYIECRGREHLKMGGKYTIWEDSENAVMEYELGIQLFKENSMCSSPILFQLLKKLAPLYVSRNFFTRAENLLLEALFISTDLFGETDAETGEIHLELGGVQIKLEHFEQGFDSFEIAYAIFQNVGGEYILQGAKALMGLGITAQSLLQYREAEHYFSKAFQIYLQHKGEFHQDTIAASNLMTAMKMRHTHPCSIL